MNTEKKLRVGILFGGRSGEHEISLRSARSVLAALDPQKYDVTQIGITHEGVWLVGENVLEALVSGRTKDLTPAAILPVPTRNELYKFRLSPVGEVFELITALDVVFPLLHGTFGEDGTIQGLFEMADLAYVGANVVGSSVGMDKGIFKDVMLSNDVPVVEYMIVLRREIENDMTSVITRAEAVAAYPLFVKPANLGSSVGVSKCRNRSDLYEGLLDAARYDRRVLIERGINAREFEVSVLGNDDPEASIVGEIIPSADFYSYDAKYFDDRTQLLIPAPIPEELSSQVQTLAVRSFKAIDAAGLARVDFLFDKDSGDLFLNELNTMPGFTSISMYPKLWNARGVSYPVLVDRLIELALQRKAERDRTVRRYDRASS
jgi:D-alanine-D-alanine ligase